MHGAKKSKVDLTLAQFAACFIVAIPYIPRCVSLTFSQFLNFALPFCFFVGVFEPFELVLLDLTFFDIFSDFSRERQVSLIILNR